MSTGKAAAQAAHASQMGLLTHVDYDTTQSPYNHSIVNRWMMGGHHAKVVLEATDLPTVERYLNDRGFKTALVIDEGRTEIESMTPTAIGTGIVDKDQGHVRATFGEFKLYADSDAVADLVLTPDEIRRALEADDSAPTGNLEGPGRKPPGDWLTTGAKLLAMPDEHAAMVRAMFGRVREASGEAKLDEGYSDPSGVTESGPELRDSV